MRFQDVRFLVEQGYADSVGAAYKLVERGRVPGAFRVGRVIKIDTQVFLSEIEAQARRPSEPERQRTQHAAPRAP